MELSEGKMKRQGVKPGFIITKINQKPVLAAADVERIISEIKRGGIFIEGIYPDGEEEYYGFGL